MIARASRCQKPPRNPSASSCRLRDHGDAGAAAAAVEREQRRKQRRGRGDRNERDQRAADSERAHERHGNEEQECQPEHNGGSREDDRAAGGGHRPRDGIVDATVPVELFAKAVDDQQRVVDRQGETDQLDEVGDIGREHGGVRDREDQCERGGDRGAGEEQRERDDRGDAQDEQEDEERGGEGDRELTVMEVMTEDGVGVSLDCRLAADVRLHARGRPESTSHEQAVGLGVCEVEPRVDRCVEDGAVGSPDETGPGRRDRLRGSVDGRLHGGFHCRVDWMSCCEHEQVLAVAAVAELLGQDRRRALRVGVRHDEAVGQQRPQPCRCDPAEDQQRQPCRQHRVPEADNAAGDAREHRFAAHVHRLL
jgi:hypothetical protein